MSQNDDLISRQAAIDAYGDWYVEEGTEEGFIGTVKQLLEGLPSAQPATNCSEIPNGSDDTINRQAAIDALDEQIEQCNKALGSFDISPKDEYAIKVERASLKAYKEQLENMPSAQPERKTGRWVSQKGGGYCCSECGRYALDEVDGNFIHVAFESNFCHYCGAEMVEK